MKFQKGNSSKVADTCFRCRKSVFSEQDKFQPFLIWVKRVSLRCKVMMTSSNGNIFRVTGHLCGEFTGRRESPPPPPPPHTHTHTHTQRPVTRSFMFSLSCAWIHSWVNNSEAGDLRRHRAHFDVNVKVVYRATPLNYQYVSTLYWALSREYYWPILSRGVSWESGTKGSNMIAFRHVNGIYKRQPSQHSGNDCRFYRVIYVVTDEVLDRVEEILVISLPFL